jgi:hypothetical protein
LWQFNQFDLFIPKIPPAQFFQKNKKSKKNQKTKNGVAGHPSIYLYIFGFFFWNFFFLEKKSVGGILGINRPNGLNCQI